MSTPDQPTPPSGWGEAPEPPRYGRPAPGAPVPPAGPPPGGQHGQGQYGQHQYGQHGQQPPGSPYGPYGPQAGKPGIVPLRPLSLGEIYDGAFSAIRHNPAVMLGLATLVLLVATVLGVLVGQLVVPALSSAFGSLTAEVPDLAGMGTLYSQLVATGLGTTLTILLATPVVEGILTVSVSQSVIGRKLTVREVWDRVRPRVLVLVGWALLRSLAAAVLVAAWTTVLVLVVVGVGESAPALTVLLVLAMLALLVAGAVWLGVRLGMVAPALALEGRGLGTTLPRAWRLTRGSFWRLFGVYLLASIMVNVAAGIVTYPIQAAAGVFGAGGGASSATFALVLGTTITTVITAAIVTIFLSSVVALLYVDLRMRREGLDVQLAAAAQQEAGGPPPGARPGTAW